MYVTLIVYHSYSTEDNTPSPNSYQLPPLLGPKVPNKPSSAAYSMSYRSDTGCFSEDLAKTPGPGQYNAVAADIYVKKSPCYSMLGRSYMPGGKRICTEELLSSLLYLSPVQIPP